MFIHFIFTVSFLSFLYTIFISGDLRGIVVMGFFTVMALMFEFWMAFEKEIDKLK